MLVLLQLKIIPAFEHLNIAEVCWMDWCWYGGCLGTGHYLTGGGGGGGEGN